MSDIAETLRTIVSGLGWVDLLLTLAVAIVALVKLRITPAGILLAIGFGAMTLCRGAVKIYRVVALDPESPAFLEQLVATMWVTSVTDTLLWLVIAVGVATIPLSLRRLARPSAFGTPSSGVPRGSPRPSGG